MRKNVLIISHSYSMQFLESCNQYAQLFDKNQYEVTVAYLTGEPNEETSQRTQAENIIYLNCSKVAVRGLKLTPIYKLLTLCRKKHFEIVMCHRYKPTYIMLWVAQFCRIPKLIFTMHAIGTMRAIPRKLLIAGLTRKNMIFAGVSDAVRDDLRQHMWQVPHDRIVTLHNILDYQLYEPHLLSREQARKKLGIAENTFVFGHIGRCVKEKDQKTLLKAYAQVKQQHTNTQLVIIGYGRLEAELKQQAKLLGIEHDVLFTGRIDDGFRFIKAFDVFILNSTEEAFGRVLLEAMMARVPIIASRVSGIPEVVGDVGFLVEPSQSEKLAETMSSVVHISQAELSDLGEKGYQRMIKYFSIESSKKTFWQLPLLNQR